MTGQQCCGFNATLLSGVKDCLCAGRIACLFSSKDFKQSNTSSLVNPSAGFGSIRETAWCHAVSQIDVKMFQTF